MTGAIGAASTFTLPRLILCEGPEDGAFLNRFIEVRALPACHICHTGPSRRSNAGITRFESALEAAKFNPRFGRIRKLLIVADNDMTPQNNFASIQRQIEAAGFGLAPAGELVPSIPANFNHLRITIMMLPFDGAHGHLESVCLHAGRQKASAALRGHIDTLEANIGADQWDPPHRGKFWLRTYLAAKWRRDSFVPLGNVFDDQAMRQANLIPLTDGSFNRLEAEIRNWA